MFRWRRGDIGNRQKKKVNINIYSKICILRICQIFKVMIYEMWLKIVSRDRLIIEWYIGSVILLIPNLCINICQHRYIWMCHHVVHMYLHERRYASSILLVLTLIKQPTIKNRVNVVVFIKNKNAFNLHVHYQFKHLVLRCFKPKGNH